MRKQFALMLAVMMLLATFAGCGSSNAPTTSESPSTQPSVQPTESAAPEAQPITWDSPDLTWRKDTSPVTYSLFLDIPWSPLDVWGTDHVSQKVTELTGVSFDVTKRQDANHLGLLLASGDLPDAVFVFDQKSRFEIESVSQPWDVLIPKYTPEFDSLIDPSEKALATVEDGHYYTIYTHNRSQAYWDDPTQPATYGESVIFTRDDIMAELGNPKLESVEDFQNILKQVKEKHPDYIPYLHPDLNGTSLLGWFGNNSVANWYTDANGKIGYMWANREGWYPYLKYMNNLYRDGLLSAEGLIYNFDQQKQAILTGKVFATTAQIFDVDIVNEELDKVPGNTLRYTAMNKPLTVDGQIKYKPVNTAAGFAGFYITQNCKDPARLMALMEFMKSPEGDKLTQWGVEGLDYKLTSDGYPLMDSKYDMKSRGDNVWYFQAAFITEQMKALAKKETSPKYAQVAQLVFDWKKYWTTDFAMAMVKTVPETDEDIIRATILNTLKNNRNGVILAETEAAFEEKFKALFDEMENAGLAQLEEYAQKQYDKYKPRFQK